MPGSPAPERPPRILPALILYGVGALVLLTVLGWVIGAVLSILRFVVLAGIAVAVIWAIASLRR